MLSPKFYCATVVLCSVSKTRAYRVQEFVFFVSRFLFFIQLFMIQCCISLVSRTTSEMSADARCSISNKRDTSTSGSRESLVNYSSKSYRFVDIVCAGKNRCPGNEVICSADEPND